LFQNNQKSIIVCTNTRLDTSFINKFLLLRDVNLYRRLNIVLLVIVQDIINKKIVDKRIHLFIYIIDANKIILQTRLYITKDIKTSIILGNNVLGISKNKISLHLYNKQIQINNV